MRARQSACSESMLLVVSDRTSRTPLSDERQLAGPPRPSPVCPLPEAERRLRQAFPEVWARYESLVAARTRDGAPAPATGARRLGDAS